MFSGLVLVKSGKMHMEMKKFVCSHVFEYSVILCNIWVYIDFSQTNIFPDAFKISYIIFLSLHFAVFFRQPASPFLFNYLSSCQSMFFLAYAYHPDSHVFILNPTVIIFFLTITEKE